jgi:polar amino acid transport system substrate-binding protein
MVIFIMAWTCFHVVLPFTAFSQDDNTFSRKILVGVVEAPPIFMKTADGQWEGLGVDIWKTVAQEMGVLFEFREYERYGLLLAAIEHGEIDVISSLPAELRCEVTMDLSQSYFKSGLAIAVPAQGSDCKWTRVAAKIFSKDILHAFGLMILMSLAAGIMVFLFEKRQNREMFGMGL